LFFLPFLRPGKKGKKKKGGGEEKERCTHSNKVKLPQKKKKKGKKGKNPPSLPFEGPSPSSE